MPTIRVSVSWPAQSGEAVISTRKFCTAMAGADAERLPLNVTVPVPPAGIEATVPVDVVHESHDGPAGTAASTSVASRRPMLARSTRRSKLSPASAYPLPSPPAESSIVHMEMHSPGA
ncbi:MAG: hypothetical protein BWX47_02029 [candidate division Hyd24-12 bacterium ADurb.Bin004]|nr:MAG: hypothetical protein BWX47_02029 [candidate division Hyd24-12 bacterium ADurb.Bin004]